jgi:ABC-2 type transport system permease protein
MNSMEIDAKAQQIVKLRGRSGVKRAIVDSCIIAWRNLLRFSRLPAVLASVIVFPILFLSGFVLAFGQLMGTQGINYIQYLVPIITLQAMFFTAMGAALTLANDIKSGMLQRCRVMPISRIAVFGGLLIAYLVRAVIATMILVSFAHLYGFRFQVGFLSVIAYILLTLIFTTTAISGYAILALWLRQIDLVNSFLIVPYAPLLLLSSGFSPAENFPSWLQPFVRFQPVSQTAAALRAIANGENPTEPLLWALVWLLGLLVIFSVVVVRLYDGAQTNATKSKRGQSSKVEERHDRAIAPPEPPPLTVPGLDPVKLVATRQEGGISRTLHDIFLITQRNLISDLRNPAVIIGATAFPVFLLLIFTAGFSRVVMPSGNYASYAQFILPLNVVQGLLFSTVNTGTALFNDLESGFDTRLRTLPIARSAVLAARILGGAGRLLIQVIVLVLVGHLIGFRFQSGFVSMLVFFLLAVIFTSSFSWIAVFFATKAKSAESAQVAMTPWLLPLTFLSIGYVPKEAFPGWLQGFVAINPVSAAAQALRGLSSGGVTTPFVIQTLVWSLGISLVFSILATRAYQHRT